MILRLVERVPMQMEMRKENEKYLRTKHDKMGHLALLHHYKKQNKIKLYGGIIMGQIFEGNLVGTGLKVGIVVGRFNEFITSKLLGGAQDALKRHGVSEADVDVAWVPGAFEIPLIAQKMAKSKKYDAVITLGTVIRGCYSTF